jgi:Conjugative transposon protein TcpC
MGHVRVGAGVRGLSGKTRTPSMGGAGAATGGGLLKAFGRAVLWLLVAVLLLRGAADLLARSTPAAAVRAAPVAPMVWPGDEARAFAADFARAYLSYSPNSPNAYAASVRSFVSSDVADQVVPEFAKRAPEGVVGAVTVARVARVDDRHALITVAAAVDGSTRYVTVPVTRDSGGGLVVDALPSFAAPPARAQVEPASLDPLSGSDAGAIEDVLTRFFQAFLAGDDQQLSYFVPPGVRIGALGQSVEMAGLVSFLQLAPAASRAREVLVTVRARDAASGATYTLSYRVRLVRDDRWLVAALNNASRTGG